MMRPTTIRMMTMTITLIAMFMFSGLFGSTHEMMKRKIPTLVAFLKSEHISPEFNKEEKWVNALLNILFLTDFDVFNLRPDGFSYFLPSPVRCGRSMTPIACAALDLVRPFAPKEVEVLIWWVVLGGHCAITAGAEGDRCRNPDAQHRKNMDGTRCALCQWAFCSFAFLTLRSGNTWDSTLHAFHCSFLIWGSIYQGNNLHVWSFGRERAKGQDSSRGGNVQGMRIHLSWHCIDSNYKEGKIVSIGWYHAIVSAVSLKCRLFSPLKAVASLIAMFSSESKQEQR